MALKNTGNKVFLTIQRKYADAGITNSYFAEIAGVPLAELYGLGDGTSNDLEFRNRILEDLNS